MTHVRSSVLVRAGVLLAFVFVVVACQADDDPPTEPEDPAAPADDAEQDAEDQGEEEAAEHDYEDGDVITLVIPTPPGGGFDVQATHFSPHFERHLQEITGVDVSIQLEYMPGGGHLAGTQFVYNAEPDGRTLVYVSQGNTLGHHVISREDVDLTAFTVIGPVVLAPLGLTATTDLLGELPSRDFEGLAARSQERSIVIGIPGSDAQITMIFGLLADQGLEVAVEPVVLEGASGVVGSLLSREIELGQVALAGMRPHVEDNPEDLEFFVELGCESGAATAEVPTVVDWDVPEARTICEDIMGAYRIVLGPPGLSEGNATVLQDALREANTSQELYDELFEASGDEVVWIEPDVMAGMLASSVETWEDLRHFVADD